MSYSEGRQVPSVQLSLRGVGSVFPRIGSLFLDVLRTIRIAEERDAGSWVAGTHSGGPE